MSRALFLDLLKRYCPIDKADAECARQFHAFIEKHENCFERALGVGHVTGSSWLLDLTAESVLLTHHRKLGKWVQLGGHADGDSDVAAVALREATEESGLNGIRLVSSEIFDLDIHEIPARGVEPTHLHFDVRFLMQVTNSDPYAVSAESLDLAWIPVVQLCQENVDQSLRRMALKTQERYGRKAFR
ncbi:MAG: NUDIX hydrolase [Oligoflexia bacterium]|nr:NUDIX hydrolase [Oligoflexia bacterium]